MIFLKTHKIIHNGVFLHIEISGGDLVLVREFLFPLSEAGTCNVLICHRCGTASEAPSSFLELVPRLSMETIRGQEEGTTQAWLRHISTDVVRCGRLQQNDNFRCFFNTTGPNSCCHPPLATP